MSTQTGLAPLLERFFTQRLMTQRQVSPHTIASYRDTFRLFFLFARQRTKKAPCQLAFSDIDVDLVEAFLADLEQRRGICARSRNLRLSAIRSFFRSPPIMNRPTSHAFNKSWSSLPNATIAGWWVFSADRKWKPSLQLRICAHGAVGGIMHCYSSLSKPACVYPN
jgi:hypothetical protein